MFPGFRDNGERRQAGSGGEVSLVAVERIANVVGAEAPAGEEALPLRAFRRRKGSALAKAPPERASGRVPPLRGSLVEAGGHDLIVDTPALELFADEDRTVAPLAAHGCVLLGKAPVGLPPLRIELVEDLFDALRA